MLGRPAGMSDDDDDDEDDIYFGSSRPRQRSSRWQSGPTNGGPKTIDEALFKNDYEALKKLIAVAKEKNLSLDIDPATKSVPLITACTMAWKEGVQLLLENGAYPNVLKELLSPLALCCIRDGPGSEARRAECVDLLLTHGADPNLVDHRGRVPLMLATESRLSLIVDRLLECDTIHLNAVDPAGWTALFYAMKNDDQVLSDKLVAAGVDPSVKAHNRNTAEDVRPVKYDEVLDEIIPQESKVYQFFEETPVRDCYKIEELTDHFLQEKVDAFLSLLPDSNGQGGFGDCVLAIVQGAGCSKLQLPNAHLPDVLSGDEELLISLGAKFSFNRQKLLRAAHNFHCLPWSKTCLHQIPNNEPLRCELIGNIATSLVQQLVVMQAAVGYLQRRVDASTLDGGPDRLETARILLELHVGQRMLRQRIQAFTIEFSKVKPLETSPVDFVGKKRLSKSRSAFKIISAAVAFLGASYIYFSTRST